MYRPEKYSPDIILPSKPAKGNVGGKLIAIGASTGGVDALIKIFSKLPKGLPPIIITQHIPPGFSTSFSQRLNSISQVSVKELDDKEKLKDSCAYLAPGDKHLLLSRSGNDYIGYPFKGQRVSRHCPSVDVMFRAANNTAGKNTLAIILTGMGDDGSIGIKELFDNGATTIAQDEESCVVFGMPKQAIARGAIKEVIPLSKIPEKIIAYGTNRC